LFYYDPQRKRPGLPPDVAALVDKITPEGVSVHLVNLHPSQSREVILKAGAFGEHEFTDVRQGDETTRVERAFFHVRLRPGAVGRLQIGMKRFVNRPSYAFPF
jgi:hypothetical protein